MMAAFTITTASPTAKLDVVGRHGSFEFTVTNTAHRPLTARAHVVTEGGTKPEWFTVADPQREAAADATHQFGVKVAVPMLTPPGSYRFRLDVVDVGDPDEFEGEGEWATIDVPPAPEPRRVPLWLIVLAAALLVAIVVVVYLVFIRQPPKAKLSATATTTTFSAVPVGQASPGSVVTISNTGGAAARVTATMGGLNPDDFKILASTCAGGPVAAGSNCQLQVAFQPAGQGARSATLTIAAPGVLEPVLLGLNGVGQGAAAAVVLQPASVAVNVPFGLPIPAATVVTVKNNGGTPVKVTSAKLDDPGGAFQAVSGCDGLTLAGGQTCQVAVIFSKPGVTTLPVTARLLITDDAPGSPQIVPVSGLRR